VSRTRERSPLGWLLARSLDDPRGALRLAFGPQTADRIVQAVELAEFETAVRKRRSGSACVSWRAERAVGYRVERALRRVVRLVLRIAERLGLDSGKAVSKRLWLGRSWGADQDGQVVYMPADLQLGLAGYLGVSLRTVERYLAVLEGAGVLKAWQPPLSEVEKLPREARGDTYAYQQYKWIGDLPRVLRGHLERWYGRTKAAKAGAAPSVPASPTGGAVPTPSAGTAAAAPLTGSASATARSLLERFGLGPPLPS
jgi:DNA-binding transcriptional ArsR family regulator